MKSKLSVIAVIACALFAWFGSTCYGSGLVVSINSDDKSHGIQNNNNKIQMQSVHVGHSEYGTDYTSANPTKTAKKFVDYSKPLVLCDDGRKGTLVDSAETWIDDIAAATPLGAFHLDHLDTTYTISMPPGDVPDDSSVADPDDLTGTGSMDSVLTLFKNHITKASKTIVGFKDAVSPLALEDLPIYISGNRILRQGGKPIVLIGYSGLGMMASNKYDGVITKSTSLDYWKQKFSHLQTQGGINYVRVSVLDMYDAAGANDGPYKGVVPFYYDDNVADVNKPTYLKYDLNTLGTQPLEDSRGNKIQDSFFFRLTQFVEAAKASGFVVCISLTDGHEEQKDAKGGQWNECPYNDNINSNGFLGPKQYEKFLTDPHVESVNEALIKHLLCCLDGLGNVIFEIMNEPASVTDSSSDDIATFHTNIANYIAKFKPASCSGQCYQDKDQGQ